MMKDGNCKPENSFHSFQYYAIKGSVSSGNFHQAKTFPLGYGNFEMLNSFLMNLVF